MVELGDLTIGAAYAYVLLERWKQIGELREEFRREYLVNYDNPDARIAKEYVSAMTSLWGELRPKVMGSEFNKEDKDKFMRFEPHYYDPNLLLSGYKTMKDKDRKLDQDHTLIFKLDEALRMAMEKLRITSFEDYINRGE